MQAVVVLVCKGFGSFDFDFSSFILIGVRFWKVALIFSEVENKNYVDDWVGNKNYVDDWGWNKKLEERLLMWLQFRFVRDSWEKNYYWNYSHEVEMIRWKCSCDFLKKW